MKRLIFLFLALACADAFAQSVEDSPAVSRQSDTLTDSRDGKEYRTVRIGKLRWMAENLNYDTANGSGSWCYDNADSNCVKYGRLYTWDAAKSACPAGWHLPVREEWNNLVAATGGSGIAGRKLKSQNGWYRERNGTDEYGFSAMPAGRRIGDGRFDNVDRHGYWWSAAEGKDSNAYYRNIYYSDNNVYDYGHEKSNGLSVRCVQD